jgi:hypothetical protein
MNAKMVMTELAMVLMILGCSLAGVFGISALMWWLECKKRWWMLLIVTLVFAITAIAGFRMPRVKEIHACVNGPVSLETVSSVYDIVSIDGKEIVLRERR